MGETCYIGGFNFVIDGVLSLKFDVEEMEVTTLSWCEVYFMNVIYLFDELTILTIKSQ